MATEAPKRGRFRPDDVEETLPVLVPGGALICDSSGRVSFGLREAGFGEALADTTDISRLAVAHFAAMHLDARSGAVDEEKRPAVTRSRAERGASTQRASRRSNPPPHGLHWDVDVVHAPRFLDPRIAAEAAEAWLQGRKVLHLVRLGDRTFVGPLITPQHGPCIVCVQQAVFPNRQTERLLGEVDSSPLESQGIGGTPVQSLQTDWEGLDAVILEIDRLGEVVATHAVRRFPDCPLCGADVADPNASRPVLSSRLKYPDSDTGARVSGPSAVLNRYEHLISPLTGAVRHVQDVDVGAPGLIHVHTASHAMALRSVHLGEFMRDGQDQSGGKGCTAEQARVSALCESLERFSAVSRGKEVDVVGSKMSLEGAISPTDCMLFSERQYRHRESWNATRRSAFQMVPHPFADDAEIAWSRVWCLQTGNEAFVPTSLLYFGFRGPGRDVCYPESNGLAAGQTLEEAILQGFLELVERDAVGIWWYNRTRHAEVDVESFHDGYLEAVVDHYDSIDRDVWVLDLTSDLGIPVFAAISALRGRSAPEFIFGFGAHFDPGIALRRCVTEMNQLLATVIQPSDRRTAQLRGCFDDALEWWASATQTDNPYLFPEPKLERRTMGYWAFNPTLDILDDVQACLDLARRHHLNAYVRDMSRPDLEIAVVKVIVPGLRHFWRRSGPGRLYEVPVTTGRRASCLGEGALNPVSLFV